MDTTSTPQDILAFWRDAGPDRWFKADPGFDAAFRDRFLAAHEAAARGELAAWADSADGALALVLLLDQLPRNAFRGSARVYATDALARDLADAAIARGFDRAAGEDLRRFFYLPFMHSERPQDQERSVELNAPLGGEAQRYALHHRDIVARFGRFPHRNAALGRTSTPEEERFLAEGGFGS
jgi:uncharacterized protein (DUF924 family)